MHFVKKKKKQTKKKKHLSYFKISKNFHEMTLISKFQQNIWAKFSDQFEQDVSFFIEYILHDWKSLWHD